MMMMILNEEKSREPYNNKITGYFSVFLVSAAIIEGSLVAKKEENKTLESLD
jgi:hypothetical protein